MWHALAATGFLATFMGAAAFIGRTLHHKRARIGAALRLRMETRNHG